VIPAVGIALLAAAFTAYLPSLAGQPLWDDEAHLTPPWMHSTTGLWRIWFERGATQQYYPITHSAFWVQWHLWGDWFTGYRLVNLALHTLNALLVWRIVRLLLHSAPHAELAGLAAAAFFLLHPVQVESVAWISELKNTLSGACYLAALLAVLLWRDPATQRLRPALYAAALTLFLTALLSKSVTATLPAAALVILWFGHGSIRRNELIALLPFFLLGLAAGLHTAYVERTQIGADGPEFDLPPAHRLLIAGRAVWFYLSKIAWPAELVFIYPRWTLDAADWTQWLYVVGSAALVGGGVAFTRFRAGRTGRAPLAAVLYFGGTLFPALGFFNVYPFRFSFVADHFQYLACLGAIVPAAAVITRLGRGGAVIVLILAAAMSCRTWYAAHHYTDGKTQWRAVVRANPAAVIAHNNLGSLTLLEGRPAEALEHFQNAFKLDPSHVLSRTNTGMALVELGRVQEAMTWFNQALTIAPNNPAAHYAAAALLTKLGDGDQAIVHYQRCIELNRRFAPAYIDLANLLLARGRIEQAVEAYRQAIVMNPYDTLPRINLASALSRGGDSTAAIAQLQRVLDEEPGNVNALFNLANTLGRAGRLEEAAGTYRRAIALKPEMAGAHHNLADALARLGRRDEALAASRQAVRLEPGNALYRKLLSALESGEAR
jgi:tetratricopeptide (TPR) repeat protein